jgi:hypothetical protein
VLTGVYVNVTLALAVKKSVLPAEEVKGPLITGSTKMPKEVAVLMGTLKVVGATDSYGANTVVSVTGPFDPLPTGVVIPPKVKMLPATAAVCVGDIKVKLNKGLEKANPDKPADPIEALERYSPNSLLFVVPLLFVIVTDAVSDPPTVISMPVNVPRAELN